METHVWKYLTVREAQEQELARLREVESKARSLAKQVDELADTPDHNNACQICGQRGEGHHDTCLYWPARALLQLLEAENEK